MKLLRNIPLYILIATNLITIMAMIFCAYSSMLPPQKYVGLSYWGLAFPVFLTANICFIIFWLIFKWKLTVMPLAGLLLCITFVRDYCPLNIPRKPTDGCLKVLSYNIMSFGSDNNAPLEDNDIFIYIKTSGADIICLQEAMKNKSDRMAELLKETYPYNSCNLVNDNYNACFSKHPIINVEKVDYPATSNASYCYSILVGKDTLFVINNHLESYRLNADDKNKYKSIIRNYRHPRQNDSEEKYESLTSKLAPIDSLRGIQADSLEAYVNRKEGQYIIACGDFNASPVSYPHWRLTRSLNDAYTRSGNGPGISYNRSGMYFRLDNIMVSNNITAYKTKVDNSIKASDHYPIYSYIKLDGK